MGSIYSGAGYLSQATRSARKASHVSGVGSIYSGKSRNHGGIAGGAAYLGSSFLSGLGSIGEGISDLALAGGALLSGNKKYAEYVFKDNTVGNWYSGISESYAPDGVMRFFGDVGQGIGQSSVFLLNAIPGLGQLGTAAFFAGVSSQGISEAASKTGKVSAREVAYGVASGAVEAGLESAFGGVSRLAESIGSGTAKSATRSAVRHGLIRRVLSDAASEFGEEFASEYAETFLQRALQIDPEKEYSLRDALYAGAVGAVSGTVTAGSGEVISAFSNERRGTRIIENGNAQTLINTASAFADKVAPTGTDFKRSAEWIRSLRASVSAYGKLGEKQKVGLRGKTMLGEIQASLYFAENQAIFGDVVSEIRSLDVGRRATLAEYVNRTVDPSRRSRDYTAEDIAADTDGIAWQLAVMRYASLCYDIDGALADIEAEKEISDAISDVSRTAEASDIDIGGDEAYNRGGDIPSGSADRAARAARAQSAESAENTEVTRHDLRSRGGIRLGKSELAALSRALMLKGGGSPRLLEYAYTSNYFYVVDENTVSHFRPIARISFDRSRLIGELREKIDSGELWNARDVQELIKRGGDTADSAMLSRSQYAILSSALAEKNGEDARALEYAYTDKYFCVVSQSGLGDFEVIGICEIEDGTERIDILKRGIDNGTFKGARDIDLAIEKYAAGKRRDLRRYADASGGGGDHRNDRVYKRSSSGEARGDTFSRRGDRYYIESEEELESLKKSDKVLKDSDGGATEAFGVSRGEQFRAGGGDGRASSDKGSGHGGEDAEISTGKSDGDSHGGTSDGGGLESKVKNEAERAVDRLIAWDKKTSPTAAELNEARGYVKNFDSLPPSRRLAVVRMIRSDSSVSAELRKSVACIMTARDSGGRLLLPSLDVRFDSGIGERGAYVSLGSRSLILLNSSSSLKDTVYSTLAHELVHCVEGRDGYAALAEYAVSTASSAEKERIRSEYEAYYRKKFTDSYRMSGRDESSGGTAEDVESLMSSERIRRLIDGEVVARIVGDRLFDGKFLGTYVRRDAGIIRFAYRTIGLIARSLKGDGGSRTAAALARRLDAALKSDAGVGIGESAVKVKLDVERDETENGDGSNTFYKENNNDSDSGADNARAEKARDKSGESARAEKARDTSGEMARKAVSFADELRRLALDAEKRSAEDSGKRPQGSASQRRASRLSAESARLARALAESVGDGGELISRKADAAAILASSLIGESDEHALLTLDGDDDRLRSMLDGFISSRGLVTGGESTKRRYERSASSGENVNKRFKKSPRSGDEAQNIGTNGTESGSGVSFSSRNDGKTVDVEAKSTDGRTFDTVSDGDLHLSGGEAKLWSDILGGLTCKLRSLTEVYYNGKWVSIAERATVCARGIEAFYDAESTDGAGNADARPFLKSLGRKINGTYFYSAVTPEAVIEAFEGYAHEGILKSFYRQVREAAQLSDKTRAQLLIPFADVLDSKKPMSDGTLFVWNDGKRKRTYRQKLYEKKVSVSGCTLTLGQGIYLYMLTKRDGARLGIESSGLKIYGEDGTLSLSVPPVSVEAAASELYAQLDAADKAYISLAEDFFNSRAKAIKADADLRAFGYENVIGGYYVPIRRDRLAHGEPVASPRQSFSNAIRIADSEINERTESASCALELSDIQSVIERHARAVADHAHLYLPLKAFDRIYREPVTLGGREVSLRSLISGRVYGKADAYLRALFDDIQGVSRRSGTFLDSVVGKLRGAWVQSVLSANIKVIATQTTSYVAARQVIEEKYLVRALAVVGRDMSALASRADEYSSLILARSFDMGALRAQGNVDRIGNVGKALGGGIEWTDRRICLLIFHAAELKAEAEGHGRVGERENSVTAARIADEAIYSTQSMSSNAERSALQRSPSEVARAFTVFTSDSMKQLSHLYSSVMRYLNHKKRAETDSSYASLLSEDRRAVGRSAVTVLATGASLALITQLFKYLYAKEEDEPEEKVRDAASDLLFSTFGIFPIASDIAEKWADGYDISLSFFDWLNGTVESFSRLFENAYRAASGERLSSRDIYAPVRDVILDVSVAFGIPAAPIERTVTGLLRRLAPGTLYEYYDSLFYSQSCKSDLAAALESGDERLASHILSSLYKHGATGSYGLAELSEVSRLYSLGFDALPREARSDGLDAKEAARFEKIYSSASDAVGSLISSKAYGMLDDRARAYAIKSVYSVYYSRALAQATGKELTGFALYSCSVSDASAFFAARAYKKYAAAYTDRFGRRITVREQLLSFLKLLGLSERDRRMIMRANGFKDT